MTKAVVNFVFILMCVFVLSSCESTEDASGPCAENYTYSCLKYRLSPAVSKALGEELEPPNQPFSRDLEARIRRYENAIPTTDYEEAYIASKLSQMYFVNKNTRQKALEKAAYAASKRVLKPHDQRDTLMLVYRAAVYLNLPVKAAAAKREYNRFMGIMDTQSDTQYSYAEAERGQAVRQDRRIPPIYPPQAAREQIEGHVVMLFDLHTDGTTHNIRVIESVPLGVFDGAAVKALEQWTYYPENQPKESRDQQKDLRVQLDFRLKKFD
jgi:TonB family protein